MNSISLNSSSYILIIAALFGLAVGSFQNVLVSRIPQNRSILGRSTCENCGTQIKFYENIPVFSYLLLKGKCSKCHSPIGIRHLFLEITVPVFFVAGLYLSNNLFEYLIWLILTIFAIPLAIIDLKVHRLPNSLNYSMFVTLFAAITVKSFSDKSLTALFDSLTQSFALALFYLIIRLLSRGGMGVGDIKLALSIGLVSGYFGKFMIFTSAYAAFILGTVVAILMIFLKKGNRKSAIPFGPFMITGIFVALIIQAIN
jgi:leader peptidase (prepilin peptidase)/N-methyltransferase